jgi:hypothetical protein
MLPDGNEPILPKPSRDSGIRSAAMSICEFLSTDEGTHEELGMTWRSFCGLTMSVAYSLDAYGKPSRQVRKIERTSTLNL